MNLRKRIMLSLKYFRFQKLIMAEGGEAFNMWKTPAADVYLKIYIFNVTNSDDFLSGRDKKLRFQEVGPYVYKCVSNVKFIFKNIILEVGTYVLRAYYTIVHHIL